MSTHFENFSWEKVNPQPAIGVDEAGRGCLFGRVYAAAVILKNTQDLELYQDSKTLSESRREQVYESIIKHHHVGIGFATVEEIEELNILQASFLAMRRALTELNVQDGHVLVDGHMKIPQVKLVQTALVKGDRRATPISAASIVAKVSRDRYVRSLAKEFGLYDLEKHKGYATAAHREAIRLHGPCKEHRKTFAGVKEHLSNLRL